MSGRVLCSTKRVWLRTLSLALLTVLICTAANGAWAGQDAAQSATDKTETSILIKNARVFDGTSNELHEGNLLIIGSKIKQISSATITPPAQATVIDAGGRVLMPGLTDAHWHMTMAGSTLQDLDAADPGLMYANAVAEARATLLRGFTTVRDMAGPTFGLKAAIDAGTIPGPRVYPSGALISQTAGHGDFAPPYAVPKILGGHASHDEQLAAFTVADGVPEVLGAVREQLKKGASQIKLAASGGVISDFDPIDSIQFSPEELRAAVQAASDWGTYVAVHVYSSAAIRRSLDAGVKSIEHGHLADEATIKLIGERDAWLSTQAFEPGDEPLSPANKAKTQNMIGAWKRILTWAKKYNVKVAFGTDLLFDPAGAARENLMLTRFAQVYSNIETLKIATSQNCELFAMSGQRNPYKEAKLGVLQDGAWADMILVNGDPTRNINLIADADRNFVVIIKNGIIYKDTMRAQENRMLH